MIGVPETVFYSIGVDHPIRPDEPLPPLPAIPRGAVLVIEGRAPIWRYGLAFHRLHGPSAGAVAVYDPRLGAVVVASHRPEFREGQVIDIVIPGAPVSAVTPKLASHPPKGRQGIEGCSHGM